MQLRQAGVRFDSNLFVRRRKYTPANHSVLAVVFPEFSSVTRRAIAEGAMPRGSVASK